MRRQDEDKVANVLVALDEKRAQDKDHQALLEAQAHEAWLASVNEQGELVDQEALDKAKLLFGHIRGGQ